MSSMDVQKDTELLKLIKERMKKKPSKLTYKEKRRFSKIRNAIKKNNK